MYLELGLIRVELLYVSVNLIFNEYIFFLFCHSFYILLKCRHVRKSLVFNPPSLQSFLG